MLETDNVLRLYRVSVEYLAINMCHQVLVNACQKQVSAEIKQVTKIVPLRPHCKELVLPIKEDFCVKQGW